MLAIAGISKNKYYCTGCGEAFASIPEMRRHKCKKIANNDSKYAYERICDEKRD